MASTSREERSSSLLVGGASPSVGLPVSPGVVPSTTSVEALLRDGAKFRNADAIKINEHDNNNNNKKEEDVDDDDPIPQEYAHLPRFYSGRHFCAPRPSNEAQRLHEIRRLQILDSDTHEAFYNYITQLAAKLLATPVASIVIMDDSRAWIKATHGGGVGEVPFEDSVCSWVPTVGRDVKLFIVDDMRKDRRFRYNPHTAKDGQPGCVFYAGVPLRLSYDPSIILGSFCVVDMQPRPPLNEDQQQLLIDLSQLVMERIESRIDTIRAAANSQQALADVLQVHAGLNSIASEAVIMWDEETHRILYVNSSFEKMTGYTLDSIIHQKDISFLCGPESSPRAFGQIERALHSLSRSYMGLEDCISGPIMRDALGGYTANPITVSARLQRKCGTYFSGVVRVSRVQSTRAMPSMLLGVISDTADEQLIEEAMEEARNVTQAAVTTKEEFLANMSHEIRTPLNGIIAAAHLLQENGAHLNEKQKELVDILYRASQQLLSIADNVLDFSNVLGKVQLLRNTVNLDDLMNRCMDIMSPSAQAKGVELSFDVASDVPVSIWTDEGRLQEILINLMGNAIKFTEHGSVTVDVSVSKVKKHPLTKTNKNTKKCSSKQRKEWEKVIMKERKSHIRDGEPEETTIESDDSEENCDVNTPSVNLDDIDEEDSNTDTSEDFEDEPVPYVKYSRAQSLGREPEVNTLVPSGLVYERRRQTVIPNYSPEVVRPVQTKGKYTQYTISFRVTDTGIGISEAQQALLRLHLYQAEQGLCKAVGGSGLGLSICQHLARAMGGDLVLEETEVGKGSTFRCDIVASGIKPRVPINMLPAPMVTSRRSSPAPSPAGTPLHEILALPRRRSISPEQVALTVRRQSVKPLSPPRIAAVKASAGMRILVVDDNATNRTLLGRMLKVLKYEHVEFAEDGSLALNLMFGESPRTFDVILLDLHMPVLDGIGCQKAICDLLPLESRPFVIAVTADITQGIEQRCRDLGMVGYLSKPLSKVRLEQYLDLVLAAKTAKSPPVWFNATSTSTL